MQGILNGGNEAVDKTISSATNNMTAISPIAAINTVIKMSFVFMKC